MTLCRISAVTLAVLCSVAAVSGSAPAATAVSPKAEPSHPNILLITLDTTRADALGCYGGDPKVSPNLDRIAGRSHLFERCEASVPQTMPSHTTIFSGLHPFNHGVRKNLAVVVGPGVPLIAEELHDLGYTTGAFVSSYVVDGRFGFKRGFDHYDAPDIRPRVGGGMERRAGDTVRLAPTLRDLLGITTPEDGVSLMPTLRGNNAITADRIVYMESLEGYLQHGWAPLFAVVRGSSKYIESPYIDLAELLIQNGRAPAAASVASEGIRRTFDAGSRLHYLKAASAALTGADINGIMGDLGVSIERAARPAAAYRLRAAVRLQRLDDVEGALSDLEAYAEWSLPAEVGELRGDVRFKALRGHPRFDGIVAPASQQ